MSVIKGWVLLPVGTTGLRAAVLVVTLEDVTQADAAAIIVARYVGPPLATPDVGSAALHFELTFEWPGPAVRYVVRALLDVDGDGRASRGDYVSTQSYPVDETVLQDPMEISVSRIN